MDKEQLAELAETKDEDLVKRFPGYTRRVLREMRRAYIEKNIDAVIEVESDLRSYKSSLRSTATRKKYKAALRELESVKGALASVTAIRRPFTVEPLKIPKGKKNKRVCVALASDWHIDEPIDPTKVLGANEFSVEIAQARSVSFFKQVAEFAMAQRATSGVLWIGGDLFSGTIHEDLAEAVTMGATTSVRMLQGMFAAGIKYLVKTTGLKWVVPCSVGNHGRTTKERRHKTELENSYEALLYAQLEDHFRDDKRVNVIPPANYLTYLDILGTVVRFHHGHNVKAGGGAFRELAIVRGTKSSGANWNQIRKADLDVTGHFHTPIFTRDSIHNGCLNGLSEYAIAIGARPTQACQTAFIIDANHGVTTCHLVTF